MMRRAVWARCAARFASGARVLEMNCGTGEDALWLAHRGVQVLATDASPAMLRVAESKLAASPGSAPAQLARLAWEELGTFEAGPFDGVLSNFGGLNCVGDLRAAACALAAKTSARRRRDSMHHGAHRALGMAVVSRAREPDSGLSSTAA